MSPPGPAVLILPAPPAPELEELLGRERASALADALRSEAERWAGEVAPGSVRAADGSLADAPARALVEHPGPLLVVWPVLARLQDERAEEALGDLRAGCDLVLGPLIDGGLYLLAVRRPLAQLIAVLDQEWRDPDAIGKALAAAAAGGFEVGILRAERALRRPSDVRAALVDPLTPHQVATILSARAFSGRRHSF